MRGSGRLWSSPEIFPEGAIQYVTLRLCVDALSVEKETEGNVGSPFWRTERVPLYTSSVPVF